MKKKTETKLAETRRDVPQVLGLIRGSTKRQDMERQHEDLDWLETRYGIQIYMRLVIEGLSGKDTHNDPDVPKILHELTGPIAEGLATSAIEPAHALSGRELHSLQYLSALCQRA